MLKRLGLRKLAYDWRDQHVVEFEDEIIQLKKHDIEFFAFWGEHESMFQLFEKHNVRPQIWKMLPQPVGETQRQRVESAAEQLLPLVKRSKALGCKLGIYNHGGWTGEPQNMAEVCQWLHRHHDARHVGIVYNFHHGHDHIASFRKRIMVMKPYLLCVNVNGMNDNAQPKILPVGSGQHEITMMKTLVDVGYRGPVGVLDHRSDTDAEVALQANLKGIARIAQTLDLPETNSSSENCE